ncbi:MAG: RNA methyltransferase, partial [Bacteroidetes bacterium]|nr:RNA methyltransferase [Bacteroidota bacterium]
MLSKNTVKFIKSLHQKKYRTESGKFFVEGEKSVVEVLQSDFKLDLLLVSQEFASKYASLVKRSGVEVVEVTPNQLEQV